MIKDFDFQNKIILGIDYGDKRIGLALGRNRLVMPITTLSDNNDETAIMHISRYVLENKADLIVVGLPLTPDGKETQQSLKVRHFSKLLKIKLRKPLEFVNEFYSSKEAQEEMIDLDFSKKDRKNPDQYAAALILKRFYSDFEV